jgi:hypothetical protein
MDHQLHHQYLQTLGISQYVPRDTVYEEVVAGTVVEKNAVETNVVAKSTGHPVPGMDMQTPPVRQTDVGPVIDKKSIDVAGLVNLDLDSKPASPIKSKVAATRQPVAEDTPSASAIEIRFSLWQASEQLLVCSAVEGALADTAEMQLLTNMLNAVGCGISRLPQMELVEWPPYPNASGDETEVREFLATLLNARLANKSVKAVLLLGEGAANWLLSPDLDRKKESGQVVLSEQTIALLLPSLSGMIENPQQKSLAWKVLQFLLPLSS